MIRNRGISFSTFFSPPKNLKKSLTNISKIYRDAYMPTDHYLQMPLAREHIIEPSCSIPETPSEISSYVNQHQSDFSSLFSGIASTARIPKTARELPGHVS